MYRYRSGLIFIVVILLLTTGLVQAATPITVTSPNGQLSVTLNLTNGLPTWAMTYAGKALINTSRLGVRVASAELGRLETVDAEQSTHRDWVDMVWGKFARYDDHYQQLAWTLQETAGKQRTLRCVLRVYDQGVALRYEFPKDGKWDDAIVLTDGATEFRFASNGTGWAYNRERDPVGPQPLSQFTAKKGADLPLTVKCASDTYLAVLEAAVFEQAPFRLAPVGKDKTGFRASFSKSTLAPGSTTSWRVILVGQQPGDLLVAPLLSCLNPPCEIADTSWIKPGLAFWDWRAWGAKTKDGFTYDLDMAIWKRFIDFASKHNIRYLILDANWYGPEFEASSNPRTSRDHLVIQPDMTKPHIIRKPAPDDWAEPIDVPALIQYAKARDVGIVLYFNDVAKDNYPFEETLALYQSWGAAGIKYGFMKAKGQQKVLDTRQIVRLCAKYQLLCDFHDGPVPPSGDERTYPNYVTREFCHSQSDAMRVFSPTGFCEQVFVNMLAGPLDMCNGLFALENPARDRPRIFKNIESTVAAETARVMITFSGLSILPDCPEAYAEKADLFEFLSQLPGTWNETRILHSAIGEYITTARRSGKTWFVASATNEQARTLPIKLDFLTPGLTYSATLYEDAPDAHFQTNREAYRVRKMQVTQDTILDARMAPGGGHSIILKPEK